MRYLLQRLNDNDRGAAPALWVALHGGGGDAVQALELFGRQARDAGALLLAPQGSRPCMEGFCWSYARDTQSIAQIVADLIEEHHVDTRRIGVLGFSMGCVMGLWLLANSPALFQFFAAIGMGSAFEPCDPTPPAARTDRPCSHLDRPRRHSAGPRRHPTAPCDPHSRSR